MRLGARQRLVPEAAARLPSDAKASQATLYNELEPPLPQVQKSYSRFRSHKRQQDYRGSWTRLLPTQKMRRFNPFDRLQLIIRKQYQNVGFCTLKESDEKGRFTGCQDRKDGCCKTKAHDVLANTSRRVDLRVEVLRAEHYGEKVCKNGRKGPFCKERMTNIRFLPTATYFEIF